MSVLGMGGLFFRSRDPDALSAWYKEHLGVGGGCDASGGGTDNPWIWTTLGGPMVFAPFKQDTDYFAADKAFMINLRVSDLDGLLAKLRSAGIDIVTKEEWDDPMTGRFARIHDPEGNAIELWEPPEGSRSAATNEMDDLEHIALTHFHLAERRAGNNLSVALDRDLVRIDSDRLEHRDDAASARHGPPLAVHAHGNHLLLSRFRHSFEALCGISLSLI